MSVELNTIVRLLAASFSLMEKSIVLNSSSSLSSWASSRIHRLTLWIDFSLATWLPDDVSSPRNIIFPPVARFVMSLLFTLKSFPMCRSSSLSVNSGMMEISADVMVYLVNRVLYASS